MRIFFHPDDTSQWENGGDYPAAAGPQRFTIEGTQILLYFGEPSPFSPFQEIYFDFLPVENYIDSGIYKITLIPEKIVTGVYNMWLPSLAVIGEATGFLYPTEETTLTIPSTAYKVISVGAYEQDIIRWQPFPGEGSPERPIR